jgi:hypothetical protein
MTGALLQSVAFQSFAQTSATRILNCTAEGVGIALLAWILLRALGRQNSGMRFAVWFSTLIGIAALPVLGHFGSNGGVVARSEITIPGSWALYIFAGWLVMALAGLIRVGIGFWHLRQLRKSCTLSDGADLDPVLRKTLKEFDSSRPVAVCVSDRLRVPTAIGFVKPLVVIPGWAMRELSPAELNTILLHELAHLRRWDDWTNLIQKVLGALLFFHPAVWWIEKKLALEREMACDDLVLAQTESPRAYAECLVTLAEKSLLRRGFALAQAAVGRMRHMSLRVAQILDEKRPRATRVWHPAPLFLTGVSLASLMMFSGVPRLVSFDNRSAGSGTLSTTMVAPNDSEEDSVSSTQAHIVPAKFEVRPQEKTSASPQANTLAARTVADNKVAANSRTKLGKSAVIPAKTTQRPVNPPMLIRSSMSAEQAITPQTLILILQTGRYDAYGAVVWDLSVWRITVMGPAQPGMEPGIVVKSI